MTAVFLSKMLGTTIMTRIVPRTAITKQNFEQLFNGKALEDQAGEVYDGKLSFFLCSRPFNHDQFSHYSFVLVPSYSTEKKTDVQPSKSQHACKNTLFALTTAVTVLNLHTYTGRQARGRGKG